MPGANLIYVYDVESATMEPPDRLSPAHLLLAPMFVNRLPWSKGYLATVAHRELREEDLLRQHCFRRWTGDYVDERGRSLPGRIEPCGEWGLGSYRLLDDGVSDALGIARAQE